MPVKFDPDATPGVKLLRIFRKLLVNGRKHYQSELASEFQCSAQTIIRVMNEIETVIGANLETGLDCRRRWYRIVSNRPNKFGLEYEELRYLSICRDFAASQLPEAIRKRVDDTIFNLSLMMSEPAVMGENSEGQFAFYSKGRIDYEPHSETLEKLLAAVQGHRICQILYKAAGKVEAREHCFAPGRLVSMNQAIYVLGAILKEDRSTVKHFTHFAVHRIQQVELTNKLYEGEFPEFEENTFGFPWHEPKEFHIHFKAGKAADYVSERIWADKQKIEKQDDGSIILHITTRSEEELMSWVRSFGNEIE